MQINWSLTASGEARSRELENQGDGALSEGQVESAWRAYMRASEFARQADQPALALRLAQVSETLVMESSIPWCVTKVHASACMSTLGQTQRAIDELRGLGQVELPESIQALVADSMFGFSILSGSSDGAERNLRVLRDMSESSGQMSALFRQSEWDYLAGRIEECLKDLAHLKKVLLDREDPGSGLAAVAMLEGEIATLDAEWELAESYFLKAMRLYEQSERLSLVLSGLSRLTWVYFEMGAALPSALYVKAQNWAEARGLVAVQSGFDVAVAITADPQEQYAAFRLAWERSEQFAFSLQGARARYLFAKCMPSHPEVQLRLAEAHSLSHICRPLRMLIEREMC